MMHHWPYMRTGKTGRHGTLHYFRPRPNFNHPSLCLMKILISWILQLWWHLCLQQGQTCEAPISFQIWQLKVNHELTLHRSSPFPWVIFYNQIICMLPWLLFLHAWNNIHCLYIFCTQKIFHGQCFPSKLKTLPHKFILRQLSGLRPYDNFLYFLHFLNYWWVGN